MSGSSIIDEKTLLSADSSPLRTILKLISSNNTFEYVRFHCSIIESNFLKQNIFMSNLMNEVSRHLTDDVIVQISRQLGAADPNQVKQAAHGAAQLLLEAISKNANSQQTGGGLFGAIERDHSGGGILGDLMGVLSGQKQANNPKTTNGEGIVSHLLGNQQLEAAQIISQMSGLHIFKSGVLTQLIAPVVMGVVGQTQKSNGLDLGGLAQVLLGGNKSAGPTQNAGGAIFKKLLDMDGDGNMMDDLLNIGMKILKK